MLQRVQVVPYDPAWRQMYLAEAVKLCEILGSCVLAIHHVGSTAIPGIKAKPIIDLLVIVAHLEDLEQANEQFIVMGYEPKGEYGIPGRRFYMKFENGTRTFNVHGFKPDHPDVQRLLNLRDYLAAHSEEAQAYSRLKEVLAEQFSEDLDRYTAGKSDFIQEINAKAILWREQTQGGEDV